MKIPIKIKILLWLASRNQSTPFNEVSAVKLRSDSRKKVEKIERFLDWPAIPLHNVKDVNITGRNGDIPIRIYQPIDKENLPVIMYFHGGGFVMRSIESHDKVCRRIAHQNHCVVISVDYRLAPEYKFPLGLHDCYDATIWATDHADIHHGDPSRLIVMGDSAGGNLATAVCLMSRDMGGPNIRYQVLIYPCTDGTLSQPSIDTYGDGYYLTKELMMWFLNHYKSEDEDIYSPYVSMMLADDLSNLPPAFVFTAEYDPLKDEGKRYAEMLKSAGNEVTFKEYGGMIHGFFSIPRLSKHIALAYHDVKVQLEKVLVNKVPNLR